MLTASYTCGLPIAALIWCWSWEWDAIVNVSPIWNLQWCELALIQIENCILHEECYLSLPLPFRLSLCFSSLSPSLLSLSVSVSFCLSLKVVFSPDCSAGCGAPRSWEYSSWGWMGQARPPSSTDCKWGRSSPPFQVSPCYCWNLYLPTPFSPTIACCVSMIIFCLATFDSSLFIFPIAIGFNVESVTYKNLKFQGKYIRTYAWGDGEMQLLSWGWQFA